MRGWLLFAIRYENVLQIVEGRDATDTLYCKHIYVTTYRGLLVPMAA